MTSPHEPPRLPVDLDMIAEFVDGLLPDADASIVAHRIETDERWSATYAALHAAMPAVGDMLTATGARPEPMPDDVHGRIMAALRELASTGAATVIPEHAASVEPAPAAVPAGSGQPASEPSAPEPSAPEPPAPKPPAPKPSVTGSGRHAASGQRNGPAHTGPGNRGAESSRPPRRRLVEARWVKVAIAIAAVAAIGGLGVLVKAVAPSATSAKSSAASAPRAATGDTAGPTVISSGTDYTAATLGLTSASAASPLSIRTPGPASDGSTDGFQSFNDAATLTTCLADITAAHGGRAVLVDMARYEGKPALIVTLVAPDLTVAVGTDCGAPGVGEHELATAQTR